MADTGGMGEGCYTEYGVSGYGVAVKPSWGVSGGGPHLQLEYLGE